VFQPGTGQTVTKVEHSGPVRNGQPTDQARWKLGRPTAALPALGPSSPGNALQGPQSGPSAGASQGSSKRGQDHRMRPPWNRGNHRFGAVVSRQTAFHLTAIRLPSRRSQRAGAAERPRSRRRISRAACAGHRRAFPIHKPSAASRQRDGARAPKEASGCPTVSLRGIDRPGGAHGSWYIPAATPEAAGCADLAMFLRQARTRLTRPATSVNRGVLGRGPSRGSRQAVAQQRRQVVELRVAQRIANTTWEQADQRSVPARPPPGRLGLRWLGLAWPFPAPHTHGLRQDETIAAHRDSGSSTSC